MPAFRVHGAGSMVGSGCRGPERIRMVDSRS